MSEPTNGRSTPGPTEGRRLGPRRDRFLLATAAPAQLATAGLAAGPESPADPVDLLGRLGAAGTFEVHRVIKASAGPALSVMGTEAIASDFPDVAVVEMEADRAAILSAHPLVHLEPDLPLRYHPAPGPVTGMRLRDPGLVPLGDDIAVPFVVRDRAGTPLAGAEVYLMSPAFPARGVTGADGAVTLSVPQAALADVRGLYVKPQADHWAVWLAQPEIDPGQPGVVVCPSLGETFPGFPAERELEGWARHAMRFDVLPPTFRGHGVKIAIIDSGAAVDHPDLSGRVTAGRDVAGQTDDGWRVDTVGHGSHTAGIIGGSDNGMGIIGVVPEAEIHSCKIFPGGRFSDLLEALDYCLANGIDLVNLSLGSPQPSELLARKIEQVRQAGIACVVAAGNSGGAVAFPANLASVLAVAAIGKTGEYPPESYHATQVFGTPTAEGYFSARFTCFGPEVDVCAPGVAVVSSVPPGNYAAWDGTSFAAPYVTGLAALLLAHHSDFRDRFAARDAGRVDRLFEIIKGSCQPLALGDPGRSGAGLPDAEAALGLKPPVTLTPPADPTLAALWAAMAQAGLVPAPMPVAPVPAMAAAPAGARDQPAPGDDVLAPLRTALRSAGLFGYGSAENN
jgi:hypothetical protein